MSRMLSTYWIIFLRLVSSNWLVSGLAVFYVVALPATQMLTSLRTATEVYFWAMMVMGLIGLGLGFSISRLWGDDSQRLVPSYRRHVLSVVTLTALAVWSVIPLVHVYGHLDRGVVSVVRSIWIWSYGMLGVGFLYAFIVARRVPVVLRVMMVLLPFLPIFLLSSSSLSDWMLQKPSAPWQGYAPMNLLALLLGPHNWPLLLSRGVPGTRPEMKLIPGSGTAMSTEFLHRLTAAVVVVLVIVLVPYVFRAEMVGPYSLDECVRVESLRFANEKTFSIDGMVKRDGRQDSVTEPRGGGGLCGWKDAPMRFFGNTYLPAETHVWLLSTSDSGQYYIAARALINPWHPNEWSASDIRLGSNIVALSFLEVNAVDDHMYATRVDDRDWSELPQWPHGARELAHMTFR